MALKPLLQAGNRVFFKKRIYYSPAGGCALVLIVREGKDKFRAFICSNISAAVQKILEAIVTGGSFKLGLEMVRYEFTIPILKKIRMRMPPIISGS